jgi:hypothetical protein
MEGCHATVGTRCRVATRAYLRGQSVNHIPLLLSSYLPSLEGLMLLQLALVLVQEHNVLRGHAKGQQVVAEHVQQLVVRLRPSSAAANKQTKKRETDKQTIRETAKERKGEDNEQQTPEGTK